jgi:hypothetical protein
MADDARPLKFNGQEGKTRLVAPQPIAKFTEHGMSGGHNHLTAQLDENTVMMMGDNPALPAMPEKPTLLDFFRLRFDAMTRNHLLGSAKRALEAGHEEKVVLACLLHDIAAGALIRGDHGYWGAQLIAPYVSEEIAWAVRMHQPLRYFADEANGYQYPDSYKRFFGAEYVPPDYVQRAAEEARKHRWYMTSRLVTIFDIYFFDDTGAARKEIDPEMFTDVIGRNFKQPKEGLGFDNSPTAHMWRTMIWPNNFL